MITTFFVLMAVKAEDVDAGTASRRTRSIGAPRLLDQYAAARASGKFSPVTTCLGSVKTLSQLMAQLRLSPSMAPTSTSATWLRGHLGVPDGAAGDQVSLTARHAATAKDASWATSSSWTTSSPE